MKLQTITVYKLIMILLKAVCLLERNILATLNQRCLPLLWINVTWEYSCVNITLSYQALQGISAMDNRLEPAASYK